MHRRHLVLAPVLLLTCLSAASAAPAGEPAGQVLTYRLSPKEPLKYRLVANVKGSLPIGESTEPADITAKLTVNYTAIPKTRLSDGTSDVDFEVGAVDLEVLSLPFTVPDDQARDVLNMTITLAKNGEVTKVHAQKKDLPFSVSVPGVDPKRLYALLFPIVFQKTPVREGDKWAYRSELLGGQGTDPKFTAMLLPGGSGAVTKLKQEFEMAVDQKLNADKKPVKQDEEPHRERLGKIDGDGVYLFDRQKGRVTHGDVTIRANIKDSLVGKPLAEDEPKELLSKVEAKVTIDLLTDSPGGKTNGSAKSASAVSAAKKEKP